MRYFLKRKGKDNKIDPILFLQKSSHLISLLFYTTMMRFDFTNRSSFLPDPNDEQYQLEKKVDQLPTLPPQHQRNLLFNDTTNYVLGQIEPYEGWHNKRITIIREYAALNWLTLGQHLQVTHSTSMNHLCQAIHVQFQELIKTLPQFSLPLFCSVLSKIDYLFHCLLPSHYNTSDHSDIHHLLKHCGQI